MTGRPYLPPPMHPRPVVDRILRVLAGAQLTASEADVLVRAVQARVRVVTVQPAEGLL